MAKKSKKKGNSSSSSVNVTFNDSIATDDTPLKHSLNDNPEISNQFKIWFDHKNACKFYNFVLNKINSLSW